MTVYLKLAGPNSKGLNPKGCYTPGWSDPSYKGIGDEPVSGIQWIGIRLDNLVVVDCDNDEAKASWLEHIGRHIDHTRVRKTPHGWHFIYGRTPNCYGITAKVPWFIPKVDLKVGPGHLIVLNAPGYKAYNDHDIMPFDPSWCPPDSQTVRATEEWDVVPDGSRNSFLASIGGKMRSWGMSHGTLISALGAVNNAACEPPLGHREIFAIAKSVSKYEPDERQTVDCPGCGATIEVG